VAVALPEALPEAWPVPQPWPVPSPEPVPWPVPEPEPESLPVPPSWQPPPDEPISQTTQTCATLSDQAIQGHDGTLTVQLCELFIEKCLLDQRTVMCARSVSRLHHRWSCASSQGRWRARGLERLEGLEELEELGGEGWAQVSRFHL
jgi:hypothetical protein